MSDLRAKNYVLAPIHFAHIQHCEASRVYVGKRGKPGPAQWWGIAHHLFLEKAMMHGHDAALVYITKRFPRLEEAMKRIEWKKIPKGDPEVQYLMDTERRESFRGSWQEADADTHIMARVDLVSDERPRGSELPKYVDHWVIDYKTGATAEDVQPGSQGEIAAAMRWQELGCPDERVGTAICAINKRGKVSFKNWLPLSPKMLDSISQQLRRTHLTVLETRAERRDEGIEPKFTPGQHCWACSCKEQCEPYKAHVVIDHVKEDI